MSYPTPRSRADVEQETLDWMAEQTELLREQTALLREIQRNTGTVSTIMIVYAALSVVGVVLLFVLQAHG